jgi:hypothetical protein
MSWNAGTVGSNPALFSVVLHCVCRELALG